MKRTPLKRNPLKRKPIKRKPISPQKKQESKEDIEKMYLLFEKHWNSKVHKCENCGCNIYGENLSIYHHHILPKSKYEEFALNIKNLILLCLKCHTEVESSKYKFPEINKRREQLLNKFK